MTEKPDYATATLELSHRLDQILIGNDLAVVETAMAVVVAKLVIARRGEIADNLDAFFDRVENILDQWTEDREAEALLNMPTKGPMQ